MKKIIVMLLFAAFMPVFAQNLLDNSSFESIDEQKNIPSYRKSPYKNPIFIMKI